MRDPENGRPRRLKSVPLLLATELRSMTAVAAVPGFESAKTPILLLLEASLSTKVTLSDAPVVAEPFTKIPKLLLFVVTLLSTPVTGADPVGWTEIPTPERPQARKPRRWLVAMRS
jgi:hypothetical protein